MSDGRFTADNGWSFEDGIIYGENGKRMTTWESLLEVPEVVLVHQYAASVSRAARDTQFSRWRSSQYPDIVVYAVGKNRTRAMLFHEAGGYHYEVSKGNLDKPWYGNYPALHAVAREYFDTHPEPEPWEKAKDGEIWNLVSEGVARQYLVESGRFFRLPLVRPNEDGWVPASFASEFVGGNRVHPAVAA